jgi:hypothetical protein
MNIYRNFVGESRGLTQPARPWESNPLNEIMVLEGMGNAIQDMMDRVDGMVDAYESYKTSPNDKQLKKNLYSSYKHASMEMYGQAPELHVSEEGFFNKAIEMLSNVIGAIIRFIGSIVSWLTGGGSGGGGSGGGGSVAKDFKEAQQGLRLDDFSKYVNTFTSDEISGFVRTHKKVFEATIYDKDPLFKMARAAGEASIEIVRVAMEEMLSFTVGSSGGARTSLTDVRKAAEELLCVMHKRGALLTVDMVSAKALSMGVRPVVTKGGSPNHVYETVTSEIKCTLTLKGVPVTMPNCKQIIAGGSGRQEELVLFSGIGFTYDVQTDKYPKSADDVVKFMHDAKAMRTDFLGNSAYIASLKKISDTLNEVDKVIEKSTNNNLPNVLIFYRNIIKSSNEAIGMTIKFRKEEHTAMRLFINAVLNMVKKGNALTNT